MEKWIEDYIVVAYSIIECNSMRMKSDGERRDRERESDSKFISDHGACDINAKRQRQMSNLQVHVSTM